MTWPDGRGPAGDEPPTVVFPPVRDEAPGIPGLHYMPGSPTLLPGPDGPPDPAGGPRRPWPLLAGLAAVAVLAALGVAWTFGRATDPPPRAAPPAPTVSVTEPVPATTAPEVTEEPSPTTPSLSVTTPPVTTVAPPPPPPPSLTTPRPELVRVPGVVGERRTGAENELRRAGFEVTVRTVPVGSRRQDRRVIAQLPAAGTPARAGSTVVLLVGERVGDDD